jgi:CarboxypepD_reg-like domain/Secretion system C-terminal sorting domain
MKKMYFLGLISLWGITLVGQITLNWQITDEQNRPLTGVSVWRQQTTDGTVTDENGRFSIDVVPGVDVLEMSYLGFERTAIKIPSGVKVNQTEVLFPVQYDLPEVSIVGSRRTRRWWVDYIIGKTVKIDSVSLEEYAVPKVRVFPNPTQHSILLQQESSLGQVDLYNLSGQKLKSFNFSDQLNASIDLSIWPAGTYLLRSSAGWVEKVQKQ